MIIYPAIDLRNGKVVRLKQGDPKQQTVYSDDPLTVAARWHDAGTDFLHVVNLDGALDADNDNLAFLPDMAALDMLIQFGGGIRTLDDAARVLDLGMTRVIMGTAIVQNPDLVADFVARFGAEHLTVGLDARQGRVATHGWQEASAWTPTDLGREFAKRGAIHALYTDVSRDGELGGVNIEATIRLAEETGLQVIASGGVSSLGEVIALRDSGQVAGAILGTALYEGIIDLSEAIRLAGESAE